MSYQAKIDFVLHLNEFNNVDLFQQGIYFLKLIIYRRDAKGRIEYATPSYSLPCEEPAEITKKLEKKPKGFLRQFGEGQIDDNQIAFITSKFPIRFCEENVPINTIFVWKASMEAYPNYSEVQFFLQAELFCADFSQMGRANPGQVSNDPDSVFKSVSTFECAINRSSDGIHEYFPIQFSSNHYCQVEATLHTFLLEFKFALSDYQMFQVNNKENSSALAPNALLIQPTTFLEFLNKITYRFKEEYVQDFFEYYVLGLRKGSTVVSNLMAQLLKIFPELQRVSPILQEALKELPPPEFFPPQNKPLYKSIFKPQQSSLQSNLNQTKTDIRPASTTSSIRNNQINNNQIQQVFQNQGALSKPQSNFGSESLQSTGIISSTSSPFSQVNNFNNFPQEAKQQQQYQSSLIFSPSQSSQSIQSLPQQQLGTQPKPQIRSFNQPFAYTQNQTVPANRARELPFSFKPPVQEPLQQTSLQLQQYQQPFQQNFDQFEIIPPLESNQIQPFSQKTQLQQIQQQQQQQMIQLNPNGAVKISSVFKLSEYKQMEQFEKFVESDMNVVKAYLFGLQQKLFELLKICGDRSTTYLKKDYVERMKERWGESVRRTEFFHDITQPYEKKSRSQNEDISNKFREQMEKLIQHSESLNIEDLQLIPRTDLRPFLLEEIFKNPNKQVIPFPREYLSKLHVFVLCHGFAGNYFDMRLIKNNLYLLYPDALFLCSKSNEEYTNGNIADMGKRLAAEVQSFIKEWCPGESLGRLSFIGHSLGGVIIRASLPHLSEYSDKMFLYMSLSSPHLGYMYNSSKLVEAGIWFLKTTRKSECLTQLHMSDEEQLSNSYLYKLTNYPGLNWFRNIALLCSYQDQYVPFESARIQKCDQASNDDAKGRLYQAMVDNLLGQLRTDRIHRIDVNFKIKDNKTIKKTIDNMIGRSAHIQFLESDALAKTLVYCFDHLFK